MRSHSRLARVCALAAVAVMAVTSAAAAAPPGVPGRLTPAQGTAPAAASTSITLITGDVVRVHEVAGGLSAAEVVRPKGATGGVRTQTIQGDLYVYPDEVLPYLASGTLDKRLFNVTGLVEMGYDDGRTGGLPLIVSGMPMTRAAAGVRVDRVLPSIRGAALTADKKNARAVWNTLTGDLTRARSAGATKIWLDGRVRADLVTSVPQVGAPQAWAAGFDGSGTKVAVLDTGVDASHPDLAGQLGEIVSFVPGEDAVDHRGHGTHVAATVGGTGAGDGLHKGVAPGTELLIGKVLGNDGFGQDSWIIAGMEWAVAQGADVVNMSLGSQEASDGTDPMAAAVNELSRTSDTLFVIAAGNSGCSGCIGSPGAADAALTVGAVDSADQLTWFSNMGPRLGDEALKPDIVAPGQDIEAARASLSAGSGLYTKISGTSMATPHVAGAAALLAQQHPDWTGEQLKDALMSSAKKLPGYDAYQVGTGRLDVAAAVSGDITATGSVYFGFFAWPHGDDAPVSKTITYTNAGDTQVTLDLSTDLPSLVTLSATSVTVPAGGTADVVATADPDLGEAGTRYLGAVRAVSPDGLVRTTNLGLVKEAERYSLKINVFDRQGEAAHAFVVVMREDSPWPMLVEVNGSTTLRLPPQVYAASTWLDLPGDKPDSVAVALLLEPEIKLDGDTTINLDARRATRVDAVTPRFTEDRQRRMTYYRKLSEVAEFEDGWLVPVDVDTMFVSPTVQVTQGEFEYVTRWRRGAPLLTLLAHGDYRRIDLIVQSGSELSGFVEWNEDAVFAGTGSAAEYEGLDADGKIVLIKRSDAVSPAERSAAAVAAGAKLLVVVNDGPGKLTEWGYSGIMVAGITARQGDPLIEKAKSGRLRMFAVAIEYTPYMYDLVDPHPGKVPGNLVYRPDDDELARIDNRFHATVANEGAGFRYDGRPYTRRMVGFPEWQKNPFHRVEWVSTPEGTRYHETHYSAYPDWESRGAIDVYAPGSRHRKDWFAPVVRPRLGLGFWQPVRYPGWDGTPETATWTTINVTPWTDSGQGNAGAMDGETLDFRLYSGDMLLEQTEWQAIYVDLPVERRDYRLVLDATRPDSWVLSTRTHTEWRFSSAGPLGDQQELIALLQLDYDVDTDLSGDVRAGSRQRIGISAGHMPGVVGAGDVTEVTLELSFDDGRTWRPVTLRKHRGNWIADVRMPGDPATFVSLRATARDDAGGSVTQEVIRAFGLR